MEKANIEKFKKKLAEEEKNILAELTNMAAQDPTDKNNWVPKIDIDAEGMSGEGEDAMQTITYVKRIGLVAQLETRYNNVKKALQRIKDGTYGVCLISGKKIELDRLNANPAAKTCKKHIDEEVDVI